jgi:NAD(P)-dependent dehydrogenase (short-subunit alcohol dehydrogenase family)
MERPHMTRKFEGQVAWVTGGGTGIGRALALELAKRGADVAVSGRREDRLIEVAREIEALGQRGLPVPCNVSDEAQLARATDHIASQLGKIDVAIANAGFAVAGPIETLSAEDWRRQLETNVVGAAMTCKHALPHLRETKGRLGLVGSVAAFVPLAKNGAYVASKYALRAIGQTLAIELAGTGVSCTTMHPGFVASEIAQVDNDGNFDPSKVDTRPAKLMWKADDAARVMIDALYKRKVEYVFTNHGKLGAFLGQHFPDLTVYAQARSRTKKRRSDKPSDKTA